MREREQVGVKAEEKKRSQGQTGAIERGGNVHIDLQRERSMDILFFSLFIVRLKVQASFCQMSTN